VQLVTPTALHLRPGRPLRHPMGRTRALLVSRNCYSNRQPSRRTASQRTRTLATAEPPPRPRRFDRNAIERPPTTPTTQELASLHRRQFPPLPAAQYIAKLLHSPALVPLRPVHPPPPQFELQITGHLVCYLTRTTHLLPTPTLPP
jgi:hypothetical protein